MGFLYTPLPLWLTLAGWIAAGVTLGLAGWRRPFARLRGDTLQHLWLGTIVALAVLWTLGIWVADGPVLHLLGAALMVALFDWALALIGGAAVVLLVAAILGTPWEGIGLTIVVLVAVPVLVSTILQKALSAWLPQRLAIFVLGHGFLTAAVSVLASWAATTGVHMLMNPSAFALALGYLPHALLLAGGEAWFSGMMLTILAIYKPAWVATYPQRLHR